jgi:IS30 family transposase
MPLRPSKRLALLQRRQQVADLYLRSWTQTAIAERLSVTQPTICEDLKRIRRQWRESAIRDFDAAREQELQKLDLLEREAWAPPRESPPSCRTVRSLSAWR